MILSQIYLDFTLYIPQTIDPDAWLKYGFDTLLHLVIASVN